MSGKKVLAIILGGGQGSRLYPLTATRSKPAVPIAGKYRLVDIPISNCINSDIKHREWYRPFAPACTVEDADKYFTHTTESPYMLLIAQVKEEFKEKLPSITHVDGTARLQTVRRETNQRYYDVIKEFGKLSGIPVILNTSFNEAGEPIVETPADAIRCFLKNDIDYLVVENYLITPIRD